MDEITLPVDCALRFVSGGYDQYYAVTQHAGDVYLIYVSIEQYAGQAYYEVRDRSGHLVDNYSMSITSDIDGLVPTLCYVSAYVSGVIESGFMERIRRFVREGLDTE